MTGRKLCVVCRDEKLLSEFGNNKKNHDGKQEYCSTCSREKDKKHYASSNIRKQKIRENNEIMLERNYQFIYEYLLVHPCVDCKETDPIVLEFDHVSGQKEDTICRMALSGRTIEAIKKEIAKCQVRCANCHKRRTAIQFNWRMLKLAGVA